MAGPNQVRCNPWLTSSIAHPARIKPANANAITAKIRNETSGFPWTARREQPLDSHTFSPTAITASKKNTEEIVLSTGIQTGTGAEVGMPPQPAERTRIQ